MALDKNGMDLKAIRATQKHIDSLPNKGRASVDHSKSHTKKKELAKKMRQTSTKHETAEGQRKNAELRKGMKRPEHGPWPIAD